MAGRPPLPKCGLFYAAPHTIPRCRRFRHDADFDDNKILPGDTAELVNKMVGRLVGRYFNFTADISCTYLAMRCQLSDEFNY